MRKERLGEMVKSVMEAGGARPEEVDIIMKVEELIEDMMFEIVVGHSKEQGSIFRAIFHEGLRLVGTYNMGDYMPYLRALDLQVSSQFSSTHDYIVLVVIVS